MKTFKKVFVSVSLVVVTFMFYSFVDNDFNIAKNLDIYVTLFKELNRTYVDDINPEKLIRTSIDGMLESLDPYTNFIPESEKEDFRFQITGQYGGVGALIRKSGDYVVISEPYENFPAQKAGIKAGDVIMAIDEKSIKDKDVSDVSDMLKGTPNTEVNVEVQRPGSKENIKIKIIREKITIPNVPYYGMMTDSTGYIRLTNFTTDAGKEVKNALVALKAKNAKSIILDLRSNPGGLLDEAVNVANVFLSKGSLIVTTKGKIKKTDRSYTTSNEPVDTIIPLVVLVNRSSASAAEIVAGALQDMDRAVVIGLRTFGKGLVQSTVDLSYNAQLKVTTAKYYIPSGRCIQALDYTHKNDDGSVGYIPDSLISEYSTKNGRKVYDGGGIEPDIKTDSEILSNIAYSLYSKNFIFDFATDFTLKHDTITKPKYYKVNDATYNEFLKFIDGKDYDYVTKSEENLDRLIEIAKKEKYYETSTNEFESLKKKLAHDKNKDLQTFKSEICDLLEEEIVTRYYYQKGRMEHSLAADKDIAKAVDVFRDNSMYAKILNGTEGELAKARTQPFKKRK
jgi:carboxyl-terminal processing protease